MEWLNYHHLLYFWLVARRGSIAAASAELRLSPPTVSAQIHKLEENFGAQLLRRSGRRLVLTDTGKLVMPYAEEIFALGRELDDAVRGADTARHLRLAVGVTDAVPKMLAYRLLEPAFQLKQPVQLVCHESSPARLFAELAVHELDLVIGDAPAGADVRIRLFNHHIGDCGMVFCALPELARRFRRHFPHSLDGAPLLLSEQGGVRPRLDHWLEAKEVRPWVAGRFDDFSMARTFAARGRGILPAPALVEKELRGQHGLVRVGITADVLYSYYVISIDRRIQHPATRAIFEAARQNLFRAPLRRGAASSRN